MRLLHGYWIYVTHIHRDGSKSGNFNIADVSILKWILLVIMLIGLVPVIGDLLKGVMRIIYLNLIVMVKKFPSLPIKQQFGKAVDASMPYIDKLLQT